VPAIHVPTIAEEVPGIHVAAITEVPAIHVPALSVVAAIHIPASAIHVPARYQESFVVYLQFMSWSPYYQQFGY
jgi:hypothetical protein